MRLLAAILVVAALGFVAWFFAVLTGTAENCDPDEPRWECGDVAREVSAVMFWILLTLLLLLLIVGFLRMLGSLGRRRDPSA